MGRHEFDVLGVMAAHAHLLQVVYYHPWIGGDMRIVTRSALSRGDRRMRVIRLLAGRFLQHGRMAA